MIQGVIHEMAGEKFIEFRRRLGATCAILVYGQEPEFEDSAIALIERMEAASLRVKGNRDSEAFVSWADLRLMLASDLRVALEYLENAS